jgi:hypothetical protein
MKANTKYIDKSGAIHLIDLGGNHFMNGVCVNPLINEGNIGDSYPKAAQITEYKPFKK